MKDGQMQRQTESVIAFLNVEETQCINYTFNSNAIHSSSCTVYCEIV